MYLSNNGFTWRASNDNLAAHLPPLAVFSNSFDDDQTLVMASADGELARTQDGGRTWTALSAEFDTAGITIISGAGTGTAMTLFAVIGDDLSFSQVSPLSQVGAQRMSMSCA